MRSHAIMGLESTQSPHVDGPDVGLHGPVQSPRRGVYEQSFTTGSLDLHQHIDLQPEDQGCTAAVQVYEPAEGRTQDPQHLQPHPPVRVRPPVEADDLTNSKVVDRLVAFSVGRMGVEALLQGNVVGAIKFLLEAQQRGVTVVADTLRRAVTLAVGTASPATSTDTSAAVRQVLSDLIGTPLFPHRCQCALIDDWHPLPCVKHPFRSQELT